MNCNSHSRKAAFKRPPLGAGHLPGLLDEVFVGTQGDILHTVTVYTKIVRFNVCLSGVFECYVLNKSFTACNITCPPTSAMDLVSGMSLGQTSTQFCA